MGKRLSIEQLNEVIGDRDHLQFLNPSHPLYKEMRMQEHPPTREEAIRLMSANPTLVRRPILVDGDSVLVGYRAGRFGV